MRILFFSEDHYLSGSPGQHRWAAAPHYRCELPCTALRDLGGHDATLVARLTPDPLTGALVGTTLDGTEIVDAELIVVQGFLPAIAVRTARRAGQRIVADLTDIFEVPDQHPYRSLVEAIRPESTAMYMACDAITVTSAYLVEYLRAVPDCPRVELLRNPIAIGDWGPSSPDDGRAVLGWCGSLAERADDCSVLRPWLGRFLEEHDLTFVHVGDGTIGVPGRVAPYRSFAEAAAVDPGRVDRRPLRRFDAYLATRPWSGITIQLIPMMDHPYSKGKSALKGLESAAQEIAFVASAHEEYRALGCGRIAGTDLAHQSATEWIDALEPLLDPVVRAEVAAAARRRVGEEEITQRWREWEGFYLDVLS